MAGPYGAAVLDFDLDFLHQNKDETALFRLEKQRRGIELTKKKIIATHSLVNKYYAKGEVLDQVEKNLFDSKEECKQVCIDYRNALQKITYLEECEQKLRNAGQELEERYLHSENKYSALQSHANQLQLLVKDYETKLEALGVENHLLKTNSKEYEKNVSTIEREKNVMLQHILMLKDVVLGKKKLNKKAVEFLKRYTGQIEDSASDCDDNDSCIEADDPEVLWKDDMFKDNKTQEGIKNNPDMIMLHEDGNLKSPSPTQHILESKGKDDAPEHLVSDKSHKSSNVDNYYDGSSELILSIDTGRGSSLAFSDSEKCFLSPDHFNDDSPPDSVDAPCTDSINENDSVSGHQTPPYVNNSIGLTSIFDEPTDNDITTKPLSKLAHKEDEVHQFRETSASHTHNNIETESNDLTPVIDSPAEDYQEFANKEEKNGCMTPSVKSPTKNTLRCERQRFELNSSNTVLPTDDNSNDFEVSTILDKMSLHYSLITPIPSSPTSMSSYSAPENTTNTHPCREAAEIREENKILQASIASLAQEVMEIKSLLKSNLMGGPAMLSTDDYHPKELSPLTLDPATKVKDNSDVFSLSKTKCEKQLKEPRLVSKKLQLETSQKEPHSAKIEHEKLVALQKERVIDKEVVYDKNNKLESQMELLFGKSHNFAEVQMPISSEIRNADLILDVTSEPTIDKDNAEVELDATARSAKTLIKVSDLCEQEIIENDSNNDGCCEQLCADKSNDALANALNTSIKSGSSVVEKLLFDDPQLSDDIFSEEDNVSCSQEPETLLNNCDINVKVDDVCNNNHSRKNYRKSKLTKLQKIRKRLQPKSKIKTAEVIRPPKRKPRIALDVSQHLPSKPELNDKAAYEKALAVVAELREKQKTKNEKVLITRSGRVRTRSECNGKPLESLDESKHTVTLQISKCRQSPRLLREIKELRTPSTNNVKNDNRTDDNRRSVTPEPDTNSITTRSRSKGTFITPVRKARKISVNRQKEDSVEITNVSPNCKVVMHCDTRVNSPEKKRSLKRPCDDTSVTEIKRRLRSSVGTTALTQGSPTNTMKDCKHDQTSVDHSKIMNKGHNNSNLNLKCRDYGDLDMFTDTAETQEKHSDCTSNPRESILCKMIEKHGVHKNKKFGQCRIPANVTDTISNTLERSIASIKDLPAGDCKAEMDKLVDDIKGLPYKQFVSGLIKFLKEPSRKVDLFNKISTPPAPPMTKSEQILLYIISAVKTSWAPIDIMDEIMKNIEFSVLRLSQSPDFDVLESLSHFYAVLCRFSKSKNRLRVFILDAMYCLTYKAIPLINTCIDVWMHVLPQSHMGIAKSPLVICIVYLLHYYKCKDSFNKVQDMRFLLKKRYSFEMTEWNDTRMLDMLKNAILELRENPTEKKMLRTALIILAKRQGTKWCQNNIVKKMLLPLIDKEDQLERVKDFCLTMLGPLMKPYPNDMKVHCEIVFNQLFDMLNQTSSQRMQEAIFISLLYIQRHDPYRVTQALLSWRPQRQISHQLELMLREFVRDKPIKVWTRLVAQYS